MKINYLENRCHFFLFHCVFQSIKPDSPLVHVSDRHRDLQKFGIFPCV